MKPRVKALTPRRQELRRIRKRIQKVNEDDSLYWFQKIGLTASLMATFKTVCDTRPNFDGKAVTVNINKDELYKKKFKRS